jgi:NIMA (never in mitosis gene a)-related kinase
LDEDLIWKLFFQLTLALHHCHKKKILHRDLKPANIFIDSTRSNIKVGDFGLSRELG